MSKAQAIPVPVNFDRNQIDQEAALAMAPAPPSPGQQGVIDALHAGIDRFAVAFDPETSAYTACDQCGRSFPKHQAGAQVDGSCLCLCEPCNRASCRDC